MDKILKKICDDVIDEDIKDFLFSETANDCSFEKRKFLNWEFLHDPVITVLHWQYIRDYKGKGFKK
jgi:hypothetical protein